MVLNIILLSGSIIKIIIYSNSELKNAIYQSDIDLEYNDDSKGEDSV